MNHACEVGRAFFNWYNHEHHHSALSVQRPLAEEASKHDGCMACSFIVVTLGTIVDPHTSQRASSMPADVAMRQGNFVFEPAPGKACGAVSGGWILG